MVRVRLYDAARGFLEWSAFEQGEACQEPVHLFEVGPLGEATAESSAVVDVSAGTYLVTATIEYLQGFPSPFVELLAGNVTFP